MILNHPPSLFVKGLRSPLTNNDIDIKLLSNNQYFNVILLINRRLFLQLGSLGHVRNQVAILGIFSER